MILWYAQTSMEKHVPTHLTCAVFTSGEFFSKPNYLCMTLALALPILPRGFGDPGTWAVFCFFQANRSELDRKWNRRDTNLLNWLPAVA